MIVVIINHPCLEWWEWLFDLIQLFCFVFVGNAR